MPAWSNGDLVLYHGTDDQASLWPILTGLCAPLTDFGQGFYLTTHLHQARQWANTRARRLGRSARVYRFDIDRDALAALHTLTFVRATRDFWSFVTACRSGHARPSLPRGAADHSRDNTTSLTKRSELYDVVTGLVTLWPQRLIIADCDQLSFHTPDAIRILRAPKPLPPPRNGSYF